MNWIKVNRDAFEKIQCINPRKGTYLLNLSPRPYTPTEDEQDVNCEVLSVKVDKVPCTMELNKFLLDLQAEYDKGDEVNTFTLGNEKCWLDKETRVGLINSIGIQEDCGLVETTLWLNGVPYKLSIEYALEFLKELELYTIECYNVTQEHISQIKATTDRDALFEFNVSDGYPTPLEFDLTQVISE